MLSEFERKVSDYAARQGLFEDARKLVLAISGGADSTALLYVMCALGKAGAIKADILCAHINHQLRDKESDDDEQFVMALAGKLNIPVAVRRVDVQAAARKRKLSIETAAREVRLECLTDIATSEGPAAVVTAHQKDDNAETIVQRLSRGTGFRGLCGIWPARELGGVRFVRPLLCVSRKEVVEYLASRGLKWREDRTNVDTGFRRNFIRHRLLPALQEECQGSLTDEIYELSERARRFYGVVCDRAERVWPLLAERNEAMVRVDAGQLLRESAAVQVEVIRRALAEIGSGERDLTEGHYEGILELTKRMSGGRKAELPGGFVVRSERGNLIFERARGTRPEAAIPEAAEIKVPGKTVLGDLRIEAEILDATQLDFVKFKAEKTGETEWFDLEKTKGPLYIRGRHVGDRFVPLGHKGLKKVGKFLTAGGVTQDIRQRLLIVSDQEKIIWLWPVRMSDEVKVTKETYQVLRLRITMNKGV